MINSETMTERYFLQLVTTVVEKKNTTIFFNGNSVVKYFLILSGSQSFE